MSDKDPTTLTTLQLGDIISFDAPVNPELHDRVFLIKYLDENQITIIDEDNLKEINLTIENNNLTDQSIESIAILDRVEEAGYAKQNGLTPGNWVNIRFGGDVPVIITGEITDLDEDMIELKTHPDGETIYIDFAYKGIPKDLPIEKIELRTTPTSARKPSLNIDSINAANKGNAANKSNDGNDNDGNDGDDNDSDDNDDGDNGKSKLNKSSLNEGDDEYPNADFDIEEIAPIDIDIPIVDVKAQLKEMIINADQIQIGEDLGSIEQDVEIVGGVRYGLEKQINDLLDELLSQIPNHERTQTVLNSIHTMIDRFVQLREEFSEFNEQGIAYNAKLHGASYKPLVSELMKLNHNILWLLPIAKNRKKIFVQPDEAQDNLQEDANTNIIDYVPITMYERESEISNILNSHYNNLVNDGQNKYDYMIQQLNPVMTPYYQPQNENDYIDMKTVGTNLTAVIDNLENFYSSVKKGANITRTRFLINKYELGENKLRQTRLRNGNTEITKVPITNPQKIAIKGFLTLPKSVSNFSRANMPRTNIMIKSQLSQHYVNYWKILRKNTNVQNTIIDDISTDVDYDKNTFLSNIRSYMLDESIEDNDKYQKFLEVIMPKTRVLFELVKRDIKNAYSLYSILDYLEPFFVYHKDLSFKQYESMTGYIRNQIKDYKRNIAETRKELQYIQKYGYSNFDAEEVLFDMLSNGLNPEEKNLMLYDYQIKYKYNDKDYYILAHPIEQINRMLKIDNNRAYTSALSASTVDLMIPEGELLEELRDDIQEAKQEFFSSSSNNCSKYVISKKYISLDELEEDNNTDVFFDKKFDKTNYKLLKTYEREKRDMGENFMKFLINKISEENGSLTAQQAEREARAIISGKRLVEDGDFAVLVSEDEDEDGNIISKLQNYERKAGLWVVSNVQDNLIPTMDNGTFCAAQKECIPVEDGCQTANDTIVGNEITSLKDSIKFFAELYPKQRAQLKSYIDSRRNTALKDQYFKDTLLFQDATKYTRSNFFLGETSVDSDENISPYMSLRDLILSQGDFVKKQHDILRFAQKFTHVLEHSDNIEDPHWLYCNVSGLKLLPSFMEVLANAFIYYPDDYINVLEKVCVDRGTISDDGEYWVDKHSGYIIRPIQYNSEEGYNAQGYKMKTRSQLEADLGNIINYRKDELLIFEGEEPNMIASICRRVANLMGVNMEPHIEFIVRNVVIQQKKSMPSEEVYNKLIKKSVKQGKKIDEVSFEDAYNSNLILLTLSYYIISLQTAIPSIKTNKTFPGCKRAFTGYPLEGTTDMSAITYVACLVQQLKKVKEQHWSSISKLNEVSMVKRITGIINRYILVEQEIQDKITAKKEYIKVEKSDEIPEEHNIKSWTNFLPSLVEPKVSQLQPLSQDFSKKILNEIQKGTKDQFKMLQKARTRIADYSVGIQELIQKVVSTHKLLLNNSNDEPFLQNACCETDELLCLDYFDKRQPEIKKYNKIVNKLSELLNGITLATRAPFLFDYRDTKTLYPTVSKSFSEDTIYQAIATYCKFNSSLPIPPNLINICQTKPENINPNFSMSEIISNVKNSGRVYTQETLDALLFEVNKQHAVHINLEPSVISKVQELRDTVNIMNEMNDTVIPEKIIEGLINILNVFDVNVIDKTSNEEARKLRNLVSSETKQNNTIIKDFIVKNGPKMTRNARKSFVEFLDNPTDLPASSATPLLTDKQNAVFRDLLFAQNAIRNLIEVIPNMIINKVNTSTINVPAHWNLSHQHNMDIVKFVRSYYEGLSRYYDESISIIMKEYVVKHRMLLKFINSIVYLAPIQGLGNDTILDDITVKLLIDYCISIAFVGFINLSDNYDALQMNKSNNRNSSKSGEPQMNSVDLMEYEDVDNIAIMHGQQQQLREKLAGFLSVVINMVKDERSVLDYSYDSVIQKVHRIKEREKDTFVHFLEKLPDEEREIEDNFKRAKLGRWGKGLKKGVFQYTAEDYDEERKEMEKQIELERKVGKVHQVTEMNREIYMAELDEEERMIEDIEDDAYDMSMIGEDNDDGYDNDDYE